MFGCNHPKRKRIFDPTKYPYECNKWGKAHKRHWVCKDCYHKGAIIVWDNPPQNEWEEVNRKRENWSIR